MRNMLPWELDELDRGGEIGAAEFRSFCANAEFLYVWQTVRRSAVRA
jgi:hypothetical protein